MTSHRHRPADRIFGIRGVGKGSFGLPSCNLNQDRQLSWHQIRLRTSNCYQWLCNGGLGVRMPPFWGTPKLHREGKNVTRMHANTPRFSYPEPPPPFRNPVSAPEDTYKRPMHREICTKLNNYMTSSHRIRISIGSLLSLQSNSVIDHVAI